MTKAIDSILFPTAYMPPIEYFILYLSSNVAYLETHEYFKRRTYANHCSIANVNGIHTLTIPVSKTIANHCPIHSMKINYSEKWQAAHWKTLETAYNKSPFFLYYRDYLEPFYTKRFDYLLDFNNELFQTLCYLLKINKTFIHTDSYEKNPSKIDCDLRDTINPVSCKKSDYCFNKIEPYNQVFIDKTGFIPNLSIFDLLCNKGNESQAYLLQNTLKTQ